MASLDSLPPDQRAVLQLVLQRGRSYDEIAQMLSIDRAAVRQRALSAFDAIGPQTRVEADRRALITDYLLGQLPPAVAAQTRERLGSSASERAWARVLASELAPIARDPLPEIPADGGRAPAAPAAEPDAADPGQTVGAAAADASAVDTSEDSSPPAATAEPDSPPAATAEPAEKAPPRTPPAGGAPEPSDGGSGRPRSLVGGAILLALLVIAIVVVIVIVASNGSSPKRTPSTPTTASVPSQTTGSTATTPPTTTSTPTTPTTTTPKPIAQINLVSPTGVKGAGGFADVVKQGTQEGIVIAAQGVSPNSKHDAYAVWLSSPGGKSLLLGFVSPPVGQNGKLETVGKLPSNAASYKDVLVTIETVAKPAHPGKIVLEGQPSGNQHF
jgi:hypothetical protein